MDAETGPPKSPPETTDARRDQKEHNEAVGVGPSVVSGVFDKTSADLADIRRPATQELLL